MTRYRDRAAILIVALVLLTLPALIRTYRVDSSSRQQMICSKNECYIFLTEYHFGFKSNYLVDAGRLLAAIIGAGPPEDRKKGKTIVYHWSPARSERIDFDGIHSAIRADADRIYLDGPGNLSIPINATLRIDSGANTFDPNLLAPYIGDANSTVSDRNAQWTRIYMGLGWNETYNEYPVVIGSVHSVATIRGENSRVQNVQIRRGEKPGETIWSGESGFRKVSRAQYQAIFGADE